LEKEIRELRSSIANTSSTGSQGIARDEQATNAQRAPDIGAQNSPSDIRLLPALQMVPFDERSNATQIDPGIRNHGSAMSLDDIILESDKVTRLFYM
jgi:hypothetical protein